MNEIRVYHVYTAEGLRVHEYSIGGFKTKSLAAALIAQLKELDDFERNEWLIQELTKRMV